ncbi:hypothetical protein [Nonomuraea dietziae]|uniref:hypothetical protein n=1 Tax=Nonomuraea dietziae TaxID=65515 RepID=UPI00344AB2D0
MRIGVLGPLDVRGEDGRSIEAGGARRGGRRSREWDFLVRHLMGVEPPGHRLTPVPLSMELVTGLFS